MKRLLCISVSFCLTIGLAPVIAAQPTQAAARSRASTNIKLDTGLVIVPFAVPVAVPVATVRQPSVLYSYRSYASPPEQPASSMPPEAKPAASAPEATTLLMTRCAACHTGAAASGGLAMFDDAGRLLARLPRWRILRAIEAGRMPLPVDAPRLTSAEVELLRQWAQPPRDLTY